MGANGKSAGGSITLVGHDEADKHLIPEQQQQINTLHKDAGEAAAKWQTALDGLRSEMEKGSDPSDTKVQKFAKDWHDAAAAFMPANDEAVHKGVVRLLHDEPKVRQDHGLDDDRRIYLRFN